MLFRPFVLSESSWKTQVQFSATMPFSWAKYCDERVCLFACVFLKYLVGVRYTFLLSVYSDFYSCPCSWPNQCHTWQVHKVLKPSRHTSCQSVWTVFRGLSLRAVTVDCAWKWQCKSVMFIDALWFNHIVHIVCRLNICCLCNCIYSIIRDDLLVWLVLLVTKS